MEETFSEIYDELMTQWKEGENDFYVGINDAYSLTDEEIKKWSNETCLQNYV